MAATTNQLRLSGAIPAVASAFIDRLIAGSGLRSYIARHLCVAVDAGGVVDRALLVVVADRALNTIGCLPRGAADLDPVRGATRSVLSDLVVSLDAPAEVALDVVRALCTLAGDVADEPTLPAQQAINRFLWAQFVVRRLAGCAVSEQARDRSMLALAALARLELEARAKSSEPATSTVAADLEGRSAYAVLRDCANSVPTSAELRSVVEEVLEVSSVDGKAFAARMRALAVAPAPSMAPPSAADRGDPRSSEAPTGPEAAAPKPRALRLPTERAWACWILRMLSPRSTQAEIGLQLGRQLGGPPLRQDQVSRLLAAVARYTTDGGSPPPGLMERLRGGRRSRPADPSKLDTGGSRRRRDADPEPPDPA